MAHLTRRPSPLRRAPSPARAGAVERLRAQAWRLANRFGHILGVHPHLVFLATRGQAPVETVRHLVTHVLLEIDRARATDVELAMGRDRSSSRNSFRRAWDLRDNPDIDGLVVFVAETRRARFADFRRATRSSVCAYARALEPTGKGGRFSPRDFDRALAAAGAALRVSDIAPAPDAIRPRRAPESPPPDLPEPARILRDSPLTRRLLREPSVAAEPLPRGGVRVHVTGRAAKEDMAGIGERLGRLLETAGFVVAREGYFEQPKSSAWRAVLRVAPAALLLLGLLPPAARPPDYKSDPLPTLGAESQERTLK